MIPAGKFPVSSHIDAVHNQHSANRAAKKDLITSLAEKELADRREKGKQYLEKKKVSAKKEEENKQSSILQQQQRRKALQDLNNQVLNKNRKNFLNKLKRNSGDLNNIEKLSAENFRPVQSKYSVLTGDIRSSLQLSEFAVGPAVGSRVVAEEKKENLQQQSDSVHSIEGKENGHRESVAQMKATIANFKGPTMGSALSSDWGIRQPFAVGSDNLIVVEADDHEHALEKDVETKRESRKNNLAFAPSVVDRNSVDRMDQVPPTHQPHPVKGSVSLVENESQPRLSLSKEPQFTVAIQAKRNFEKVRKVLGDVDRMCSMLHTQTVELEEKLKVRDSVDSFKVDSYKVDPIRVEPSNVYVNANVNDIRSSISEKLYSKVFDLFRADPSNNSSLETKSSADDLSESNHPEAMPNTMASNTSFARNNDSSREDQDSVLMDEYDDRNESIYERTLAPVPETMYDRNGSNGHMRFQEDTSANKNVSSQTRSYVPTPFPVGDPFLTQHLGVLADKKDILGKFSDYIDEYKSDYYSDDEQHNLRQEADRNEVGHIPVEMWSLPGKNMSNNSRRTPSTAFVREPFPSLRNVGELAGLLRTDFEAQVEKMASFGDERNKAVRYSDAEESEDEFSVVALFAKEYMKRATLPPPPPSQDFPVVDDGIPVMGDIAVEDMVNDTPYVETSDQYSDYAEQEDYSRRREEEDQRELQESQTFWNSLLNRPLRNEVVDLMDNDTQHTSFENERILHDLQMNARLQEIQKLESDALKGGTIISPSPLETKPVIKYSAAELRARMVEELRRQEDIFNYTIELAEIQQANSLQAARDLAIQSNTRTEIEIMDLQKRKELELQQLAYENSIAISVANAHLVSEQKNAEQRILVERLQAELEKNQLQQDFSSLLQQASQISANYETNERLLALDKAIDEDKRSRMQQEYEARQKISEAKASAFAAEVVAKAAVQFRQPTIILSNSEQQTDLPPARVGVRGDERIKSSSDSVNNDEYSISFDQESLMASSMIRDMQANDQRKPKSMDVIREGRDSHSSMDENSSEIYEEDDAADQSIMESIATQKVSVGKQRTNITNVDNSYSLPDEVSHDSYGDEINEDSIQESNISRNKSALDHSIQSLVSGTNMSHSILSEKVIKENNRNQKGLHKNQSYQSGVSRTISNSSTAAYDDDEFESSAMSGQSVQEDIKEESNDSIQEESISNNSASLSKKPSTEPPEDDYSSYSDSFASKSLSNASGRGAVSEIHSSQSHSQSISEVHSSQSRSIPSQALPTAKKLLTDGSEIPGTESLVIVHDTQADLDHALALLGDEDPNSQSLNFDERMIHETLELYKKDMEARLRGQERTYALRLRFVKAKKQHRLNLVSSSSHEEKQKVEEEYEEEKAHLERERWTMNANAYKELRKFKQLQKDLLAYNMSLKNSGKSNSEERAKKLADLLSPELNESDSLSSTGSIQEVTFSKARTRKEKVRTEKSGRHVDTTTAATSRLPTSSWRPEKASERFHAVEEVEEYEDADIVSVSEREKSVALKFSSAGDESYVNEDFDEYASSRNSTAVKPKQPLKQALSDSTESIKSGVLTEEFDDDAEDGGGKEIESSVRNSLREQKLLEVSVADEIKDSSASVARSLAADTEHSAEYSMSYDSQSHLQNSLEQNDHAASSSKKYVLDAFEEDDSVVQTESSESRTEDIVANDKDKEASIESKHDNAKKAPLRDHVTTSNDHQDSYGSTADYSLDYDGENSVSRTSVLVNDKADKGPATAIGATADSQPQDMSDEISEDIEEEGDDEHEDADPENHRATHISEHPHHHSPNQSHESLRNLKEQSATENQDLKDSYLDDDDFEDDFEAEEDVSQDPANQNEQLAVEEVTSKSLPKPIVVDDNSFEDEIPEESIASSEKQSEKGDDDGGDDSKFRLDNSADRSADNVELLAIKGDNHQQQLDVLQVKPAVSISPLTETTKTPAATAANNTALLMDDEIDSVMSEVLEEPEAAANDSSFESHSIENTPQKDLQTPVVVASPSDKQAAADYSESEVEQSIDKPSNDVILGSNTTSKANNDNEDDDDNSYEEEFEDDFDDNDGDDNEPTPATLPLPIKTDNQIVKLLPSHGSGVSDDGSIAASVPESIEDDLASEKSASVQVNDAVLKYPRATVGFVDEQNELEEVEREYELDLSDVPDPQNVVSASSISKLRSAASSGNMVFDSEQQKWVGDDVSMDGFSDSDYDFRGHGLDKAVAAPLVAPEDVPITASQHLNLNLSTLSEDSEPHAKNLEINISILSEVSDQPNSALYKKDQFSVLDDEVLEESEDKTIPWVKPVPPAVIEKIDIAANELFEDNYNEPFVQADEDTEFSSDTVEGRLEDLANPQIKILDLKETTTTKDVPKESGAIKAEKQKKEEELQTVDDITSVLFDRMLRDILGTLDGASTSTSTSKPVRPSLPARNLSNDDDDDDDVDFEEEEFSSDTIEGPLEYGTVRYDMLIEIPVLDDKASKTDDLQMKAAEKKKSSLSSLSDFPSPMTSVKSKPTILELAKDLDDLYEFDFSGESSSYVPPSSSPITVRTEPVEVSTLGIQDQDNEPSDSEEKRTSPFWDTMVEDTKVGKYSNLYNVLNCIINIVIFLSFRTNSRKYLKPLRWIP